MGWLGAIRDIAIVLSCGSCARGEPASRARGSVVDPTEAGAETLATADASVASASPITTRCDPGEVLIFVSPAHPVRGRPFRVVAVTDRRVDGTLAPSPDGGAGPGLVGTMDPGAGPPYVWILPVEDAKPGRVHVALAGSAACGSHTLAALDVVVADRDFLAAPRAPRKALWSTRRAWTPLYESLYSAWVAHLFQAPGGELPSWGSLDEVLSDRSRNFLFDHLGAAEDEQGTAIRPDCADLPYFLRAYFSFKLGLPFGWSRCSRGDSVGPPKCAGFSTSEDPFPSLDGGAQTIPPWADPERPAGGPWENNVKRVAEMLRTTLADSVQSGAGRTAAEDEESDYYPVLLSLDSLRPGTIFADPYGHVLVLASRVDQTPSTAGALFAVDAQPDGTVSRKRFWRGNFLFAIDPALGSAGFKRFRPIVRGAASGRLRRAKNAELADLSSTDQYVEGVEGFYDKVEDLLSPEPLDPMQALLSTVLALEEQLRARVISVENGRKFLASGAPAADMPDGEKIFETTGAWEDYSTPSRDLRVLMAVDVTRALPESVARRPYRFKMPDGRSGARVSADLQGVLEAELHRRRFTYVRSDGSERELKLSDVVDRQPALEMAYNPNDCVELRWGAPPGSDEASTCRAHAPAAQVAKMTEYRAWFHERRRPPR
jgi:hypothetical protein